MASNLESLAGIFEPLLGAGVDAGQTDGSEAIARLRAALERIADSTLEVAMIGPDPAFRQDFEGIDGFVEAWLDWLSPFSTFRMELDDVIEREDRLVTLVRQYATPVGGSVEIENVGAAIWWFRDGRLARVEFHLDRDAALRSAGLEPVDRGH